MHLYAWFFRLDSFAFLLLSKFMNIEKYRRNSGAKVNSSFTVPLDIETVQELTKLSELWNVRAWARDLIRENLPELKKSLGR